MPQMSPLMWSNLFMIFSLALIFSMVKVYFSSPKKLSASSAKQEIKYYQDINWMW